MTRADNSIQNCIRMMRTNSVGSVLVLSDDKDEKLIGIFTERDLLLKVELIKASKHWEYPIRTVMTSHPIVVELSEVNRAGKLMLQHNFRHLPVVIQDYNRGQRVVGMVSMRDLFRKYENQQYDFHIFKSSTSKEKKELDWSCEIYTQELDFKLFIDRIVSIFLRKSSIRYLEEMKVPKEQSKSKTLFILDIDQVTTKSWTQALKQAFQNPSAKITVVFNPTLHSLKTSEVFKELENDERFIFIEKPIDLLALSEVLSSILHEN